MHQAQHRLETVDRVCQSVGRSGSGSEKSSCSLGAEFRYQSLRPRHICSPIPFSIFTILPHNNTAEIVISHKAVHFSPCGWRLSTLLPYNLPMCLAHQQIHGCWVGKFWGWSCFLGEAWNNGRKHQKQGLRKPGSLRTHRQNTDVRISQSYQAELHGHGASMCDGSHVLGYFGGGVQAQARRSLLHDMLREDRGVIGQGREVVGEQCLVNGWASRFQGVSGVVYWLEKHWKVQDSQSK